MATRHAKTAGTQNASRAFRKRFSARLQAALDAIDVTAGYGRVRRAAELLGVSANTASLWLNGKGVPELPRLPAIARTLGCTIDWLCGSDVRRGTTPDDGPSPPATAANPLSAGCLGPFVPCVLRTLGLPEHLAALTIDDDTMFPQLKRGDVALYDPDVSRFSTTGVYVLRNAQRTLVRRLQQGIGPGLRVLCDNPLLSAESLDDGALASGSSDERRVVIAGRVLGRILVDEGQSPHCRRSTDYGCAARSGGVPPRTDQPPNT